MGLVAAVGRRDRRRTLGDIGRELRRMVDSLPEHLRVRAAMAVQAVLVRRQSGGDVAAALQQTVSTLSEADGSMTPEVDALVNILKVFCGATPGTRAV